LQMDEKALFKNMKRPQTYSFLSKYSYFWSFVKAKTEKVEYEMN
jgi:hypothetical protein